MTRFYLLLIPMFLFGVATSEATNKKPLAMEISNLKAKGAPFPVFELFKNKALSAGPIRLPSVLKTGDVLTVDKSVLQELYRKHPQTIQLVIPSQNRNLKLSLTRAEIFTADARLNTEKGPVTNYMPGLFYRGIAEGNEESLVAISFFQEDLVGLISTISSGNMVLARLTKSSDLDDFILYSDKDLLKSSKLRCKTDADKVPFPDVNKVEGMEARTMTTTEKCLKIYYEINFDIYQKNDSSVAKTLNWTSAMHHATATLFFNDGIKTVLNEVFVWTSPTPFYEIFDFANYRRNFNGDLAGFISGLNTGGFALGIGGFCTNSHDQYGGSGPYQWSDVPIEFDSLPAFSRTIEVVTHEFGHILGSHHTHNCVWNGNNTQIEDCGNMPTPYPFDIPFSACYDSLHPILPDSGTATIMSYCPGVNFAMGFGPQPSERIRVNLNNATCLGTDCIHSCVPTLDSISVFNKNYHTAQVRIFDQDTSAHNWEYRVYSDVPQGGWNPTDQNPFTITISNPLNIGYRVEVRTVCPNPFSAAYQISSSEFHLRYSLCDRTFYAPGVEANQYYDDVDYREVILPWDSTYRVGLHFQFFQTDFGDTLCIYNGPTLQDSLIGRYSGFGDQIPDLISTHPSGSILLDFISNSDGTSGWGWKADATCVLVTSNQSGLKQKERATLSPNPGRDYSILEIPESWTESWATLFDLVGRPIQKTKLAATSNQINLKGLPRGMYTIKVNDQPGTLRLILE